MKRICTNIWTLLMFWSDHHSVLCTSSPPRVHGLKMCPAELSTWRMYVCVKHVLFFYKKKNKLINTVVVCIMSAGVWRCSRGLFSSNEVAESDASCVLCTESRSLVDIEASGYKLHHWRWDQSFTRPPQGNTFMYSMHLFKKSSQLQLTCYEQNDPKCFYFFVICPLSQHYDSPFWQKK